jgi:hypothetical protein
MHEVKGVPSSPVVNRTLTLYWLAGLLEGEGTFMRPAPSSPRSPILRLAMTDRDVVERAAVIWQRAVCVDDDRPEAHFKPVFITTVRGAPAVEWMRSLYPVMSEQRRRQIDAAIRGHVGARRSCPGGLCRTDGCPQRADIRGLCTHHYKLWWKAHRRGRSSRYEPAGPPDITGLAGGALPALSQEGDAHVAWLAGLLEGEGTLSSMRTYPLIRLEMCARDVVRVAADVLGVKNVSAKHDDRAVERGWSPSFCVALSGARAADWMRRLRPWMGARRTSEIDRALGAYHPIRLTKAPEHCVVPGCDAPHRGRGLCHRHYMLWDRDRKAGKAPRVRPLR